MVAHKGRAVIDDKSSSGPADKGRINLGAPRDVHYWTYQLGCSEAELIIAVRDAGDSPAAVRAYLAHPGRKARNPNN
jgi:hypothetical protein